MAVLVGPHAAFRRASSSLRRDAPFAVFPVRSSRRVGLEYGRAEQAVGLAAYRREQIVFVPIGMAFGRPEIVPAPEAFVRNESEVGARPLFQVAARIAVKPFGTVQNVGLVGPEQVIRAVACDGQDIRVADMNPGERHARSAGCWPVALAPTERRRQNTGRGDSIFFCSDRS